MEQQNELALGEGIKAVAEKSTGAQLIAFLKGINIFGGKSTDAKAKDEMEHGASCDCAECKGKAADAKAKDRERYHKALDRMMDSKEAEAAEEAEAADADMEAIKALFTTPSAEKTKASGADSEEEQEEEEREEEKEEKDGGAADEDAEAEAEDEAVQSNASPEIPAGDRNKPDVPRAVDEAYKAGAMTVLKAMKPFVARSKDKALSKAFDTTSQLVKGTGWKGSASYSKVAKAAGAAHDSVGIDPSKQVEKIATDAETAYAAERKRQLGR